MNLKQANRMLHHAWVLRTQVRPKYFNMNVVCQGPVSPEHPCGTAACAMGYMPLAFPNIFKMELFYDGSAIGPVYRRGDRDFDEMEFYGIDGAERCVLFYPGSDRTPKRQAKVMEDFVRSKGYEVTDI